MTRSYYTPRGSRVTKHVAEADYDCRECPFKIKKEQEYIEVNQKIGKDSYRIIRYHLECWRSYMMRLY
jgi:hypothetical protein